MATMTDLAIRTLQKLQALGLDEIASAEDKQKAEEKLRVAHTFLRTQSLVRWTLNDIPDFAEEPYVMVAAYFATSDFGMADRPDLLANGMKIIQAAVNLPSAGTTQAEYF